MQRSLFLCAALAATLLLPARAADDHAHHAHGAKPEAPSTVKVRYDDAQLTDQDGRVVKLRSEAIGERIVVVDFVYTTCTTVCPVLTTVMSKVQDALGPDAGDVRLLTLSVDPARDTPARMKQYGEKFGVKAGWLWLTGPTGRVNEVLKGFGAYAPSFEDHPALILVGDARTGQWTRFYGFADPKDVVARVQALRGARAGHAAHQH